jgi:hypothetical protein
MRMGSSLLVEVEMLLLVDRYASWVHPRRNGNY